MSDRDNEIIDYFEKIDRSFFMEKDKEQAKLDRPFSIGHGQTISQPSLVLKMTLALKLRSDSKVLEIGTGSGFQTALLAAFSYKVFTVERIKPLYKQAKSKLQQKLYHNVYFKLGDGSEGWEDYAPFDRIMVTAAASRLSNELLQQLGAGGKMVIPIGDENMQELTLVEKDENGQISSSVIEYVRFVRLKGKYE